MEKNNYTIKYSAAFINQFNSILKYLVYQLKNKIAADNFHNQSLFPQPNIITKKSTNIIISNNTRTNTLIIKLKNTLQIQISRNNSLSNFRRLIQKSSINNIKQLIKSKSTSKTRLASSELSFCNLEFIIVSNITGAV